MKTYTFRQRTFLNPESTNTTFHILVLSNLHAMARTSGAATLLILADCHRSVEFKFCLGNAEHRRLSPKKINLMIDTLSGFRDALTRLFVQSWLRVKGALHESPWNSVLSSVAKLSKIEQEKVACLRYRSTLCS